MTTSLVVFRARLFYLPIESVPTPVSCTGVGMGSKKSKSSVQLKKEALALAEIIYDVYRERKQKQKSIVNNGQNDARSTSQ